jgi:hypothetical protein
MIPELNDSTFNLIYDNQTTVLSCEGIFRPNGTAEDAPFIELLEGLIGNCPSVIRLNLQKLEYLNSMGISIFSHFIIKARDTGKIHLILEGSTRYAWQKKSLHNLQKLSPGLELVWY